MGILSQGRGGLDARTAQGVEDCPWHLDQACRLLSFSLLLDGNDCFPTEGKNPGNTSVPSFGAPLTYFRKSLRRPIKEEWE